MYPKRGLSATIQNPLKYFFEVCKQESFTKASEMLYVSQPTITTAIKTLERDLGIQLFDRNKTSVSLTTNGMKLHAMTEKFLRSYDNFLSEANDIVNSQITTLRLGLPAISSTYYLKKIMPAFYEQNPDVRLVIKEVPTLSGLKLIDNAELDLLIGTTNTFPSGYEHRLLREISLVLFFNPRNPITEVKKITREILINQPFIMLPKGSHLYEYISSEFRGISLNVMMHSSQIPTIRYMIQEDFAVTILYSYVFEPDDRIIFREFDEPLHTKISLFWKKDIYVTTAMKKFISFTKEFGI
jgi:DNA-binding transcriptional LysR family regulator